MGSTAVRKMAMGRTAVGRMVQVFETDIWRTSFSWPYFISTAAYRMCIVPTPHKAQAQNGDPQL